MVERNKDGTLKKGSTANPNGRPKIQDSIRGMIREKIDFNVVLEKVYAGILEGDKDFIKIALEYGFGKPTQHIETVIEEIKSSPMAEAIKEIIDEGKNSD